MIGARTYGGKNFRRPRVLPNALARRFKIGRTEKRHR
jgi:hypothetical protein